MLTMSVLENTNITLNTPKTVCIFFGSHQGSRSKQVRKMWNVHYLPGDEYFFISI
jgi:hypothetical protein